MLGHMVRDSGIIYITWDMGARFFDVREAVVMKCSFSN